MIRSYSQYYLNKCARTLGFMLHGAVVVCGMDGADFLERFIQSGIAKYIEEGSPKYIAGKSGIELYREVLKISSNESTRETVLECYERSPVYWVGWVLAHYQWYSCLSFRTILAVIPYEELLGLYKTLHEADIQKSYEVFDAHFARSESRLKNLRKKCGMTQAELAKEVGVSVNTIRAFERKSKSLGKARIEIVLRLAKALKCEAEELIGGAL